MKNMIVAVLIVISAAALAFTTSCSRAPEGKADADARPWAVMDVETAQPVQMTVGEWGKCKLDPQTGYRIDPKTGKKLAETIHCVSCQAAIPAPAYAPGSDEAKVKMAYICPACKKNAYPQDL